VVSSLKLAIDSYFNSDDLSIYSEASLTFINIMNILDFVFNAIFFVEMAVKVVSLGFCMDFNSYLKDTWSKLDFTIVFFSIIDMSLSGYNLGFLKIVRMLRILRPLRFISHNPNMKALVYCLLESVGGLMNVLIVIFLIW
jgi:hypothetical protein